MIVFYCIVGQLSMLKTCVLEWPLVSLLCRRIISKGFMCFVSNIIFTRLLETRFLKSGNFWKTSNLTRNMDLVIHQVKNILMCGVTKFV